VENPGGASGLLPGGVRINAWRGYFPFSVGQASLAPQTADWSSLGNGAGHEGLNPLDSGGARYQLVWQAAAKTTLTTNNPLSVTDGVLATVEHVAGGANDVIVGLDAHSGRTLWRKTIPGETIYNPPAIANGSVYFQTCCSAPNYFDTQLHSLDLRTGATNWDMALYLSGTQSSLYPPLLVGDTLYAYATSFGSGAIYAPTLYALNSVSGQLKWLQTINFKDNSAPAYARNSLYTWQADTFTVLNPTDGSRVWELKLANTVYNDTMNTVPVISGNSAVLTSHPRLYVIDLPSHTARWSTNSGDYGETIPAVADGRVYAFNQAALEERSLADGTLSWSYTAPQAFIHAPVLTSKYLYAATASHTYVFDRGTHRLVWQTDQGGWLALANGYLYIATTDQRIFAYQAQQP
jgi:hypothetical protein